MSTRTLIIVGVISLFVIVLIGTIMGLHSAPQNTLGLAEGNATWYQAAQVQQVGAPAQYVGAIQAQPVMGSQYVWAGQALPAPIVHTEYVTVPAPLIVESPETGTRTSSGSTRTGSSQSGSGYPIYNSYPTTASQSGSYPYPTFADYMAQYNATHPSYGATYPTYNPYGGGSGSGYNPYSNQDCPPYL